MARKLVHSDPASDVWHHTIAPGVVVIEQYWHQTGQRDFTLRSYNRITGKFYTQNPISHFENVPHHADHQT